MSLHRQHGGPGRAAHLDDPRAVAAVATLRRASRRAEIVGTPESWADARTAGAQVRAHVVTGNAPVGGGAVKTLMLLVVALALGCGTTRSSRAEACYDACAGSRGEYGLAAACACTSRCRLLTADETRWCLEHSALPVEPARP